VGVGTPQSMKPYLEDGSSSAAILWDVEALGYLTAWTGAKLANGEPFDGTDSVETISEAQFMEDEKTMLLGDPLQITTENVDDYSY
jgi:rhamnose transport system substrate-binding protein